jgi:hypothetical protein
MTGGKRISTAIQKAFKQAKAVQRAPPRVFQNKKIVIVKELAETILPRVVLPQSRRQNTHKPAFTGRKQVEASRAGGKSIARESRGGLVIQAPTMPNRNRIVTALSRATVHTCYMTGSRTNGDTEGQFGVKTRSRTQSREQSVDTLLQNQDARVGSTGPVIPPAGPNPGAGGMGPIILPPPGEENVLNSPDEIRELREQAEQSRHDYLQSQTRVAELVDLVDTLTQQMQATNNALNRLENERVQKNPESGNPGRQNPQGSSPVIINSTTMPPPETGTSFPLSQEALKKLISDSVKQEVKQTHELEGPSSSTPYSEEHNLVPYPPGFIQPNFAKFKGTGDPVQHVNHFVATCGDIAHNQSLLLRQFSRSLEGIAFTWYAEQRPGTFLTWNQMKTAFMDRFGFGITDKITLRQLSEIKPNQGESISRFIQRWRNQSIKCEQQLNQDQAVELLISKIDNWMKPWLCSTKHTSFKSLMEQVNSLESLRPHVLENFQSVFDQQDPPIEDRGKGKPSTTTNMVQAQSQGSSSKQENFTLLNTPLSEILMQVRSEGHLRKAPPPLRTPPEKRDKRKYCDYHCDHGHNTDECQQLRLAIEDLIQMGHLEKYVTPS